MTNLSYTREKMFFENQKNLWTVIPAKAGIQELSLD